MDECVIGCMDECVIGCMDECVEEAWMNAWRKRFMVELMGEIKMAVEDRDVDEIIRRTGNKDEDRCRRMDEKVCRRMMNRRN